MPKKETKHCVICGSELAEDTRFGKSLSCVSCQSKTFLRLEETNGTHFAIFLNCGMHNIPCEPSLVPIEIVNSQEDKWEEYLSILRENGYEENEKTFFDGVKDVRKIFGRNLTESDFSRYIAAEKDRISSLPGTEEQRERWGKGELIQDIPFTDSIYDELDSQLKMWKERYKGQTVTPQLESSIITICKRNMMVDYLLKSANYADAAKVQKMVDDLMASEQMRKKDEKPIENLRMDALVDAMERFGLMENGQLLTYDELVPALRDNFVKSPKYRHSIDAADQMILDYYNNFHQNADMPLVSELPAEMEIVDEYGEFLEEETEEEKKRKRYAGLTKVQFAKKEEGGK